MQIELKDGQRSLLKVFDGVGVLRGLAELRAGRPVLVTAQDDRCVALPVEGACPDSVAALRALSAPAPLRMAMTSRRARVLGISLIGPVLLPLGADDDLGSIWALASDASVAARPSAVTAGPATAAALALTKLAQRLPALLIADAAAVTGTPLEAKMVTVDAVAVRGVRDRVIKSLALVAEAPVPLREGVPARFHIFHEVSGGTPVAVVIGKPDFSRPVPVRLHSACLTGDVFGSRRCDCGEQLQLAISRLMEAGSGVIVYLEQEGRGLGLANKMRAYALQDEGLDTVDANTTLGFDDDERDYGVAARMLQMLGCPRILLLTNNPDKLEALAEAGVEVCGRLPLRTPINADNRRYLAAKASRAGHWLDGALAYAEDEPSEPLAPTSGS
jgi:GTP cyclohydrolase II